MVAVLVTTKNRFGGVNNGGVVFVRGIGTCVGFNIGISGVITQDSDALAPMSDC